ncbi:MAG: hypothetical protein M0P61_17725 [Ignavibacteriaceae bacterium]|jgi:hypothetical protein|nr:hypothetical protein [Ignavibacteriaceae bacterium]
MNKRLLKNLVVIRVIYIVLAILVAAIFAALIAVIATLITEDIETIVISCLAGIWIAEVILYIARCKITFNKRMKAIVEVDESKIIKKKNNLIKQYVISTVVFALVLGFTVYNLKDGIVTDIIGGTSSNKTESMNENWLIIKIGIVIILLVILLIRLRARKRYKDKMVNETAKQNL